MYLVLLADSFIRMESIRTGQQPLPIAIYLTLAIAIDVISLCRPELKSKEFDFGHSILHFVFVP